MRRKYYIYVYIKSDFEKSIRTTIDTFGSARFAAAIISHHLSRDGPYVVYKTCKIIQYTE